MRSAAVRRHRSRKISEERKETVDVGIVMVDRESDAKHVGPNVGDAVPLLQLFVPARRVRRSEGEESRMRRRVERVEKLGIAEPCRFAALDQLALKVHDIGGDARRRQAILQQHPLYCVEAIKGRRIECRSQKAPRILRVANAAGRQLQVLEFGIPAGNGWAWTEAGRRVEEC